MKKEIKLFLTVLLIVCAIPGVSAQEPTILISYYSRTGTTKTMAEAVARGAGSIDGVKVVIKTVEETTGDDLLHASAIIVGSPVYNANIAPRVAEFITSWPFENAPLKDKIGAAFVTAGGISAGEEIAMLNILHSMMIFGMITMGGDDWTAPFGASMVNGEATLNQQQELFLTKGEKLGQRVALIVLRMND